MIENSQSHDFNFELVVGCATIYSVSTGLGCVVSGIKGENLHESGLGCKSCMICDAAGLDKTECFRASVSGMPEAERFGGKYIYFCPMGLTCFSSPIIGYVGSVANITAGPFLMTDLGDFMAFDLKRNLAPGTAEFERVVELLAQIPSITPSKVDALSNLLFLTASFINNASATQMTETQPQDADAVQGQISDYMLKRKGGRPLPEYPVKTEKKLLESIADSDKPKAQKLLNELLGHILFSSGGDFDRIKSKTHELLVMISRGAIDAGASTDKVLQMNHRFWRQAQSVIDIDGLCLLLSDVMNRYIDSIFDFSDKKNIDVMHRAVEYMNEHYTGKITLEDVAKVVYMSSTYFSKVFKREMGCSFSTYLSQLRIEKSKQLLLQDDVRMADIVEMVGFEDHSYFTKVFKRVVGVSPKYFRKNPSE